MRTTQFRAGSWLLLFFGLLTLPAAAQQPSQSQVNAVKQNCRSDYQTYCASVPPGGQASLQCLQRNLSNLSPACGSAVGAIGGNASAAPGASPQAAARSPMAQGSAMPPRQEAAVMRRSCGGDYRAYCRGVPLGGGRAIGCLAENEARLSQQCRGALAELRAAR